jgi:hypothetical protein
MGFEITVHEQSLEENVTGETVADDLAGALKAAEAMHAYERVLADQEPEGFDKDTKALAHAGVDAAVVLVGALGKKKDHYRVSIHGGDDHINVHVHRIAGPEGAPHHDEEESGGED